MMRFRSAVFVPEEMAITDVYCRCGLARVASPSDTWSNVDGGLDTNPVSWFIVDVVDFCALPTQPTILAAWLQPNSSTRARNSFTPTCTIHSRK